METVTLKRMIWVVRHFGTWTSADMSLHLSQRMLNPEFHSFPHQHLDQVALVVSGTYLRPLLCNDRWAQTEALQLDWVLLQNREFGEE